MRVEDRRQELCSVYGRDDGDLDRCEQRRRGRKRLDVEYHIAAEKGF